jgi:hypothetical protein
MKIYRTLGLLALALGLGTVAWGREPFSRQESVTLTGVVESVDQTERALVVKGESGDRVVVVAGPEVRNFAQIKNGDRIVLTYFIGIAAKVKPRGTPAAAPVESMTAERSSPGQKPALSVGRDFSTVVKIESVDKSFNTVTFKRADGITRVVAIQDPDSQKFIRSLKPGDSVEVSYNEATAIGVEPAPAK